MAKEQPKENTKRVGRQRKGAPREISKTFAAKFGKHLEQLVDRSGMTVPELSQKLGVTKNAVYSWCRGISVPHVNDWPKLARILRLARVKDLVPDE